MKRNAQRPNGSQRTSERRVAGVERVKALLARPEMPGMVLIACTALALLAANTGIADWYHHLLELPGTMELGPLHASMSLHGWVNDGLMAIFFFAIGLEIKRELLIGHLSSFRRSALPILGAIGGMAVPAAIYAAFNAGGPGLYGWGIPMATDIAFAVGVLSLLGSRIPPALKVFLLALAIADDLGAVIVIAVFYSTSISLLPLLLAIAGWLVAIAMNARHVRAPLWYVVVGIPVWFCMYKSGVHATIAGVMMGLAIPVRTLYDGSQWLIAMEKALARYRGMLTGHHTAGHEELGTRQEAVHEIEKATEKGQSPLIRLEHALAPWVSYAIMPAFALANAGVTISRGSIGDLFANGIAPGVFVGLLLGKQAGVFLFCWLAVRTRVAEMPRGTTMPQFYGASMLAGIGFTMSIFVTELSFNGQEPFTSMAKLAILCASLLAGVLGYLWLRIALRR
ncbi:MAG TPA: Na+/H+ antiporter NhaA [Candidatus Kapabacteria bacterium]|nr:Na+/H+ antiporter NhaA [Candidatus Kapabacteria bacterium]